MKPHPKITVLVLIVVIAGLAVAYDSLSRPQNLRPVSAAPAQTPHDAAPDFTFTTLSGDRHRLAGLKGKGVLVHFWASWCVTCVAEFPALLESVDKQGGRIALLAVSIDDDRAKMQRALDRHAKAYKDHPSVYWIWDEGKEISLKTFNVMRVPETVFIDRNGLMTRKAVGETDWRGNDITAVYKQLIQE